MSDYIEIAMAICKIFLVIMAWQAYSDDNVSGLLYLLIITTMIN